LLEIEEIRAKERTSNKVELDNIEISVRMNLANSKAKLEDYEAVLTQAKTVSTRTKVNP
jgi:thioredoxin-like negative regulator of GroEL